MSWIANLDTTVLEYLSKLQKEGSEFSFNPSQNSVTTEGKNLNLGFSCYALKILKLIGSVDKFFKSFSTVKKDVFIAQSM